MIQLCNQTVRRTAVCAATAATTHSHQMASSSTAAHSKYEKAVQTLNGLQSNAATIKKMREYREQLLKENVPDTKRYLETIGISVKDLDTLNIIHVSGTKGKGSTCAFVERILRSLGYKTGLYTSPHLVHVRERIRINGQPISEQQFTKRFFEIYNQLIENQATDGMPAYFKFLTLLAFHVCLHEQVDVLILEVGIGGENDCTNCVESPVVCGITTLDFDHTSILGNKMEAIAWQKAGIMKKGRPCVHAPAIEEALNVFYERSVEKNSTLFAAPSLEEYKWSRRPVSGIAGDHQNLNISVALQLVGIWLKATSHEIPVSITGYPWKPGTGFVVNDRILEAIETCKWPGRSEIFVSGNIRFLLDGAHTPKSMQACRSWAKTELDKHTNTKRVLLFQCTADRHPSTLLDFLKNLNISTAIFCPTQLEVSINKTSDIANLNSSEADQLEKAHLCAAAWKLFTGQESIVHDCVSSAVAHIQCMSQTDKLDVLVTGSLHLVGGVLSLIRPID